MAHDAPSYRNDDRLLRLLKLAVLTGWALWFSVVLLTNVLDALRHLGLLPDGWRMASGNFDVIRSVTARYHIPDCTKRSPEPLCLDRESHVYWLHAPP